MLIDLCWFVLLRAPRGWLLSVESRHHWVLPSRPELHRDRWSLLKWNEQIHCILPLHTSSSPNTWFRVEKVLVCHVSFSNGHRTFVILWGHHRIHLLCFQIFWLVFLRRCVFCCSVFPFRFRLCFAHGGKWGSLYKKVPWFLGIYCIYQTVCYYCKTDIFFLCNVVRTTGKTAR